MQIVTVDEERHHSLERGAFAYLAKPATSESISDALERIRVYTLPRTKRLLIVEDDAGERLSIEELIRHDDVDIDTASQRRRRARRNCCAAEYDCVVLDLRLPDMSGFELLDRIAARTAPARGADRRVHRQGSQRRGRPRACAARPRASSSRASNRPSACSTKPRCSCIA